jgi:hypothetical protein
MTMAGGLVRTHGFVAVVAACLAATAAAQESVRSLPLGVFSQSSVPSPQVPWNDICKQPLGEVPDTWNKAKVTDVGTETKLPQDAQKLRVKFKSGAWIVTAIAPKGNKLRAGEDVELKQDGSQLSVRRRTDTFRIRITCVRRPVFLE